MLTSIDPVCGKTVEEEVAWKADYSGRQYFFDSEECLRRFEREPERYVEQAA